MHKRKRRRSARDDINVESIEAAAPDPCLYIQAHEADVIRGPSAVVARTLEYPGSHSLVPDSSSRSGLIQWGAEPSYGTDAVAPREFKKDHLWVDR